MLVLYHGSGATDFEVVAEDPRASEWPRIREAVFQLLEARGEDEVADLINQLPFKLYGGTNHFGDEFPLLLAHLPIPEYTQREYLESSQEARRSFRQAAKALEEAGCFVRFIAIAPEIPARPSVVAAPDPAITSGGVERALRDAQILFSSAGPASAVDRVHTAIHAYVREICNRASIPHSQDVGLTDLFRLLREQHPSFTRTAHDAETTRMLRAIATIIDTAGTLRNRASNAHPNDVPLEEPEAYLVINAVRTLLHYLDAKIR